MAEGYSVSEVIAMLEERAKKTILYLRPRRFGKSLFVNMLHHYYGLEFKGKFDDLFGKYYIGQHPTPLANQHLILNLDLLSVITKLTDIMLLID